MRKEIGKKTDPRQAEPVPAEAGSGGQGFGSVLASGAREGEKPEAC